MPRLDSLATRLVLGSIAGAVLAVAIAAVVGITALRVELTRFSAHEQQDRTAQVVAALEDAFRRRGAWSADDLAGARDLASSAGASLALYDASGATILAPAADDVVPPMFAHMRGTSVLGPERREPLVVDGATVGTAVLRFPSGDLLPAEGEMLDALTRAQFVAAAVAAIAAVPFALFYARRVTRPVARLAAATRALRGGERGVRVSEAADDELAGLARGFNDMASALEREDRLRRDLLADVAHELRTPLTTLQGHLEALRDGVLPADTAAFASLYEEAERLGRLVADLESLARAEAAGFSLERSRVDLGAVTRDVAASVADRFRTKGVALDVRAASADVDGDPDRLAQIARNLLENALKFTPSGGHVRVDVSREAADATLAVADDGAGIPADELPRIFDRFWRGRDASGIAGSGIGLTVARALARAHGGDITAESALGRGTTFRVRLPLAA